MRFNKDIVKAEISKIIMGTITGKIRYIKDKNDEIILPVTHERSVKDSNGVNLETKLGEKQDALVSGLNIKTINEQSIVGPGNITVSDANAIIGIIFNGASAQVTNKVAIISSPVPTDLADLASDSTHRTVTDLEKESWNEKQASLTFDLTPTSESLNPVTSGGVKQSLDIKENISNKVVSLSSSSTNAQYPSALCVYNLISELTAPFGYKVVESLPTASASTIGDIYVVSDGSDTVFYITSESSGNYSWEQLGGLDTSVSTITEGEIDSLFE